MIIKGSVEVEVSVKGDLCNGCQFEPGDDEEDCILFSQSLAGKQVRSTTYNVRCKPCIEKFGGLDG